MSLAIVLMACSRPASKAESQGAKQTTDTKPVAGEPPTRLSGPTAGFSFSMTKPQAMELCRNAGFEIVERDRTFPNHPPVPTVICAGLPAKAPLDGSFYQVELWFCDQRVCAIKLASSAAADYASVRSWAVERYGEPQAAYEQGAECTQALHDKTGCYLGGRSDKVVNWFEGPPTDIRSIIRLSHGTYGENDYIFLWFTTSEATKYWR
ncbi:MAG: hypothetical protein ACKV2T_10975 [Kofleriaceae bacterium]